MIEYAVFDGGDAEQVLVDEFVRLVQEGGAVDENFVRNGIRRQGARMVVASIDDKVVGVAARKVPLERYRSGIESETKAGYAIPQELYPFELGYVVVPKRHRGQGIGEALVNRVLQISDGHGLFATTGHLAMKDHLLPRAGFELVGTSWKNDQNEDLHLFVFRK